MAVTLDTSALIALVEAFERKDHPLADHMAAWHRDKVDVFTASPAWCEFWRGRGSNDHYNALLRKRVRVLDVDQKDAEVAADALRDAFGRGDTSAVAHIVDALVMAVADRRHAAVYTADRGDFERLWDRFLGVKSLVTTAGAVVRRR